MKQNTDPIEKTVSKSSEKKGKIGKSNLNPGKKSLKIEKNGNNKQQKSHLKDNDIDIINQIRDAKEIEDLKNVYIQWNKEKAELNEKNKILKAFKEKKEEDKVNNKKNLKDKNNEKEKLLEKKKILEKIRELKRQKEIEEEEFNEEDIKKLEKKMKRDLDSILQREYLLSEKEKEDNDNFLEKLEYIAEVEKYIQNEIKINKDDNLILTDDTENFEDNVLIKILGYIGSELSLKNIKAYIEIKPTKEKLREIIFKILVSGLATQQVFTIVLDNEDYQIIFYQNIEKWFSYLENIKGRISNIFNISQDNIYFFNHNLNTFEADLLIYNQNLYKLENILKNYNLLAVKHILLSEIILSPNIFNINFCKNENEWPENNLKRGGKKYYPPYGLIGVALKIDHKYDKNNNVWLGKKNKEGEWPVAYLGIAKGNVFKKILSVINNSLIKDSENFIKNIEKIQNKFIFGGEDVYVTPNIKNAIEHADIIKLGGNDFKFKFVIMARVNPNKIRSHIGLKEGWILRGNNEEIRPYRLLIKEI